MAGYLIAMSDNASIEECIKNGCYSTHLNSPRSQYWSLSHEGTFADYLSMKEDDLVFFFSHRRIYGCGRIINVGPDCKYLNYPNADMPNGDKAFTPHMQLIPYGSSDNRCFCTFVPHPSFFLEGIDMDEVLQSKSNAFRSVRTLWKLSFIKLDDEESTALFGLIIKHNEASIGKQSKCYTFSDSFHQSLQHKPLKDYRLSPISITNACLNASDSSLRHEMALEAALCSKLTFEDIAPFGKWDYISHQVAASPFKPVDYIDKIDIFGYRYISGYHPIKSRFLIAELKKVTATTDVIEQIMKYVDWVASEYADGDYSMIEAYIVAYDFPEEVLKQASKYCVRNFTKGYRPSTHCIWNCVKLVRYRASIDGLEFEEVPMLRRQRRIVR